MASIIISMRMRWIWSFLAVPILFLNLIIPSLSFGGDPKACIKAIEADLGQAFKIDFRGQVVSVKTLDGRKITGPIVSDDGTTLVIRGPDGKDIKISKANLEAGSMQFRGQKVDLGPLVAPAPIPVAPPAGLPDSMIGQKIQIKSKSGNTYSGVFEKNENGLIHLRQPDGSVQKLWSDRLDFGSVKRSVASASVAGEDAQAVFRNSPSITHDGGNMQNGRVINGQNRLIIHSYDDFDIAKSQGRIFENTPVTSLPEGRYTYVITKDGKITFGRVDDATEFGVKHFQIARGRPISAAGEIKIGRGGKIYFNAESGTFSKKIAEEYKISGDQLGSQVGEYLRRQGVAATYMPPSRYGYLLPTRSPTAAELVIYCRSVTFASTLPDICPR